MNIPISTVGTTALNQAADFDRVLAAVRTCETIIDARTEAGGGKGYIILKERKRGAGGTGGDKAGVDKAIKDGQNDSTSAASAATSTGDSAADGGGASAAVDTEGSSSAPHDSTSAAGTATAVVGTRTTLARAPRRTLILCV